MSYPQGRHLISIENIPRTIWWGEDETTGRPVVYMVDQTRLPLQGDVLACNALDGVCLAIQSLAVRGAPALGVAAALALANEVGIGAHPGFADRPNFGRLELPVPPADVRLLVRDQGGRESFLHAFALVDASGV